MIIKYCKEEEEKVVSILPCVCGREVQRVRYCCENKCEPIEIICECGRGMGPRFILHLAFRGGDMSQGPRVPYWWDNLVNLENMDKLGDKLRETANTALDKAAIISEAEKAMVLSELDTMKAECEALKQKIDPFLLEVPPFEEDPNKDSIQNAIVEILNNIIERKSNND